MFGKKWIIGKKDVCNEEKGVVGSSALHCQCARLWHLIFLELSSYTHPGLDSFNTYLLSAFSMPGALLGPEDTEVNQTKPEQQ